MTNHRVMRFAIAVSVAIAAAALPAAAATSFDFMFSMDKVHNDSQYFLNVAVSNYGYQPAVLMPVLPRVRYVETDLPVMMFLSHESGWPLPRIVDLRAGGSSWSVIFTHVGVPLDALFVGIPEDPGPPYGKAWGYWKKHPRGARLADADVCNLVKIQMASRWVGAPAYEVARGYSRGVTAPMFVAEKRGRPYRNASQYTASRHNAPQQAASQQGEHHGGNSASRGHGQGHGKPGKPDKPHHH